MSLAPLLDILKNPDHPAYEQALEKLAAFNMQNLNPQELPTLLAELDAVIATLSAAKDETAAQLRRLRTQGKALASYGSSGK